MSKELLEYQELDKKLKKLKKGNASGSAEDNVQKLNETIKNCQNKILELEEQSKKLLSSLDKLMEVQKKGIAYVQKCSEIDIENMSEEELKDFDAKATQTAKQLAELDGRIASHNAEVKKVVLDYKLFRKKILDAKEKRENLKQENEQKNQDMPNIDDIKKEMAKLEKLIEPAKLAKYKALKQDGIFPVLVPLAEKRCGGCRMELSSSALSKLETAKIYECEHCHRLIVVQDK